MKSNQAKNLNVFENRYCEMHYLLATYEDRLYSNMQNKMNSEEWKQQSLRLEHTKNNIESLQKSIVKYTDEYSALKKSRKKDHNKEQQLSAFFFFLFLVV